MAEQQSSYRQIFKATSLFGGVQIFNILIGIVRVKFVAVLLGTAGVGILGLMNAPLAMIASLTGLGIAFSAVRDISEANGTGDQRKISVTIIMLRRWSWFTGLFGAVITISFAPLLSQWTFGSKEYTWAFVWLSVTLLLQAISKGQSSILQGTRRLKDMAKAGVIGSLLGFLTSMPLYYWFGIKGIVPAMIITAITGLFISWYFSRKVKIEPIQQKLKESYLSGLGMAKLGIFMTLSSFIASASGYVLNAFVSNRGGIEQVGLYNAGWGVVAQYTGLIFTAMSTDYFPRLSAINTDIEKVKVLVRQQAETALFIITPLLALLIITMPLVIRLLYTPAFIPVVLFANLTVLGMPLKVITWAIGFIYLAKGNGRLFFIVELIYGIFVLAFNLLGYYFWNLEGLGVSFIVTYIIGFAINYIILNSKYGFDYPISFARTFIIIYFFSIAAFLSSLIQKPEFKYAAGFIVFIIATSYCLYQLNKMMDIKTALVSLLNRVRK